ncbi:MAG: isoprenylcysteine carboxylmethyltransferase family protein [Acidobacteriaceae bacterium]
MKATRFEFRFRLWISFAIYFLGFWAPWLRYGRSAGPVSTAWLELSGELARWVPVETASVAITLAAILLAAAGTAFRVWGTAYIGGAVVQSSAMHAQSVVAGGPYRYLRNPLYFGIFLFALAVSILMPPSGAVFFLVASFVQVWRLILREEPFLETQQGETYRAYKSTVSRLLPNPMAGVAKSTAEPRWLQALVAEVFYVTMTACFAVLAWRYDTNLLIQALLICFGLSLVVRAFAVTRV